MRFVVLFLVVVAVVSAYIGGSALVKVFDNNARNEANTALQMEVYKAAQLQEQTKQETARLNAQVAAQQSAESARLAYLNHEAEARREFYAFLVANDVMTAREAARAMFDSRNGAYSRAYPVGRCSALAWSWVRAWVYGWLIGGRNELARLAF